MPKLNVKKSVIILLILILTCILSIFSYTWYRLHDSIWAESDQSKDTPAKYNLTYKTKYFKTKDNTSLSGWYIPAENPKAIIIMVHGYTDSKAGILDHASYLHDNEYTTFFIDLRGDSPEIKYTLGVEEWKDIEAAYDYIKSIPESKNKKVGFYSASMGAASAVVAMGKTGKGDFIIASVPYTNFKNLYKYQLSAEKLPAFLLPFLRLSGVFEFGLNYDQYSADKFIKNIKKPIFLMSATYDEKVNPNDAKYLFDLANEPKYFWQTKTKHKIFKEKPEEWKRRVLVFLTKSL